MKRSFSHRQGMHSRGKYRLVLAGLVFLIVALLGSAIIVRGAYQSNLKPLNSSNESIVVTIDQGSTPGDIASILKTRKVIKSDWAFEWYVRNNSLRGSLKAGTYAFKPSQSIPEIVDEIISGKIATDLVTILPGKRLEQVREGLIKSGFKPDDVDKALNPDNYPGHPALSDKPKAASLEGFLYPESFQKTANTTASEIVGKSLDEMASYLTPDVRAGFFEQKLSVYQAIILASIVEQEVSKPSDKPLVAQVFLKRFHEGMNLGADPTALYGSLLAGKKASLFYDSPYNTRLHSGLPPGPIGNASEESLKAVAFPAHTDWLFFVAGDDGITYFSKTLEEHEALTREHCKNLCKSY